MAALTGRNEDRNPWALGFEWLLIVGLLPVAIPLFITLLFQWFDHNPSPFHSFMADGDLLLASTVLSAAVAYDISDALGKIDSKKGWMRLGFWIFFVGGVGCMVFFTFLKVVLGMHTQVAPSPMVGSVAAIFFVFFLLVSFAYRVVIEVRLGAQGLIEQGGRKGVSNG